MLNNFTDQNSLIRFIYETIDNPQKRRDFVATFTELINAPAAGIIIEDHQNRWAEFIETHYSLQGRVEFREQ